MSETSGLETRTVTGADERIARLTPAQRELLRLRMRRLAAESQAAPTAIPPRPRDAGELPLALDQERFWFVHQLDPQSASLNTTQAVRLDGELDAGALARAQADVVARQETLRTTFREIGGRPSLAIHPPFVPALPVVDLGSLPEQRREVEVRRQIRAAARRPFDLETGPMLRLLLLRLAAREHLLILGTHHVIADRTSVYLVAEELMSCYAARVAGHEPRLPALPVQFADFAHWQRSWFEGEIGERQLAYWAGQLEGAPPLLALPTDFARPRLRRRRGGHADLPFGEVGGPLSDTLRELAREREVTLYMVLLAGLAAALSRWSEVEDVVVGSPFANRGRPELRRVVGYLANNLVLRTDLSGDPSFDELLERVKETVLGAQAHPDLPIDRLIEALEPERDLRYNPLFQVVFSFQNMRMPTLADAPLGLRFEPVEADVAQLDLILEVVEDEAGLAGSLTYARDLFEDATIDALARFFVELLGEWARDPRRRLSELSLPPALAAQAEAARSRERVEKVVVAATFTAELIEDALGFWMEELGTPAEVVFAPYNQVFQQLLDPRGVLAAGRSDVNLLLLRLEDWLPETGLGEAAPALDRDVGELVRAVEAFTARSEAPCLVVLCPPSPSLEAQEGVAGRVRAAEERLRAELGRLSGVELVHHGEVARSYPVAAVHDPHADELGKVPYTPEYFTALATAAARRIHALRHRRPKVVVVDCDQTLWAGVCAEDGPLGIVVDPQREAFQRFLVTLQERGILLAMCSKNEPGDVLEVFARRPEMPLRLEHFVDWEIGWDTKSEGLRRLAARLDLGLDSFVMIDDNPLECAEIRARLPQVATLRLPAEGIDDFSRHVWLLDLLTVTAEDRRRTELYQQNRERQRYREEAPSLESFLAGLELDVETSELRPEQVPRVAQLTQRTNQFNSTTWRRTEAELAELVDEIAAGAAPRGLSVRVSDRFGDYGLVGWASWRLDGDRLEVEALLLSCRVLGRGVEHRLVAEIGRRALDLGVERVALAYVPSERNRPIFDFLRSIAESDGGAERQLFVLPAARAAALRYQPEPTAPEAGEAAAPSPQAGASPPPAADWRRLERIALELREIGEIHRRVQVFRQHLSRGARAEYAAPSNPIEEKLAEIFAELLACDRVGVHDDFFRLGGHSLLGTVLLSRVRDAFGVDLPLRGLFEHPTVSGLASAIEERGPARGEAASPALERREPGRRVPLSRAQERLWFLARMMPESSAYNIPVALRVRGELKLGALRAAVAELVRRHESLRTSFPLADGEPVQLVAPPSAPPLPVTDLRRLPPARREVEAERRAAAEARRPFDLVRGPVLRVGLSRLAETEWVFSLTLHHVVGDGWSMGILLREIGALYDAFAAGRPSPLGELEIQYGDFAVWERRAASPGALEEDLAYWRRALEGEAPRLHLPADRPHSHRRLFRAGRAAVRWPAAFGDAIAAHDRRAGTTSFMTLLAGWLTLLARVSAETDLWVGSVLSNRGHRELEAVIGFLVDTVVLRTDLGDDPSFETLLERVRETVLGALAHRAAPFEEALSGRAQPRDEERRQPYQTMLVMLDFPMLAEGGRAGGLDVEPFASAGEPETSEDLNLYLQHQGSAVGGVAEYNAEVFDRSTVERLLGHYRTLLEGLLREPARALSEHPLLTRAERHQLVEWNATRRAWPRELLLHRLFDRQAERTPEAVALVFAERALSYAEVDRRSRALAGHLQALGARPEARVGICLERGPEMMIAVLAVLRAGAAYVPLDADYPRERLARVLESAGLTALVTRRGLSGRLPAFDGERIFYEPGEDLAAVELVEPDLHPDHPVYAIYTSGSTGKPKGILLSHGVMANLLEWHLEVLPPRRRMLQFSTLNFDVSIHEIFATWGSGGALEIVPEPLRRDVPALAELLIERRVEKAILPVVVLQQLAESLREGGELPSALREVITTGEQLQVTRAVRELMARLPAATLHNHYGPAETHVVTAETLEPGAFDAWPSHPPVGRPISNARIHLVDRRFQEVPTGVVGELFIAGDCLARGYLDRPALTADRFVPDPFANSPGERLYRTGDLARHRPGGAVEFLGRIDHQVKIHGYRIEMEEVEGALAEHPEVLETVVLAREDQVGERRLVAYVVAAPGASLSTSELARFVGERLPPFMVPSVFQRLERLPLDPNGKIDRRALPVPGRERPELAEAYAPPEGEDESLLAEIWGRVLGLDRIGRHDHFLELGGDSVSSLRIAVEARRRGLVFEVRELLEHPRIAELAKLARPAAPLRKEVPASSPAAERHPLSPMQVGILFHALQGEAASYLEHVEFQLDEAIDPRALERAWVWVVERHAALRSAFDWRGGEEPVQTVHPEVEIPWGVCDLRGLAPADRERLAARHARAAARGLDLERPPLLRWTLWRLGDARWRLLFTYHHLIADGWSSAVVLEELETAYRAFARGETPELAAPRPFWEVLEWRRSRDRAAAEAFWREKLAGVEGPTLLGLERRRPDRGWIEVEHLLSERQTGALRELARRRRWTLNTLVQGGSAILLSRYAGEETAIFGNVVSGRPAELPGIDSAVGLFIDNLPLVASTPRDLGLSAFLDQLQGGQFAAAEHEHLGLAEVQRLSPLARSERLFDYFLVFASYPAAEGSWRRRDLPSLDTGYPLYLLAEPASELRLRAVASAAVFAEAEIERLLGHLAVLLEAFPGAPETRLGELPLLRAAELHQVLAEWNDTRIDWPEEPGFVERFAAVARRHPERIAVAWKGEQRSYGLLAADAAQTAYWLRGRGVGRGAVVALLAERGPDFLTAIIAIQSLGAAYLPLDPKHPRRRQEQIVEASGAAMLLDDLEEIGLGRDDGPDRALDSAAGPRDLAYVIYTSGSTGTPKGVMVEHRGMLNHLEIKNLDLEIGADDVVLQNASQTFDVSVWQFLSALLVGGRVLVVPDEVALDSARLLAAVEAGGATVIEVVPSLLAYLVAEIDERERHPPLRRVRWLVPTGEALPPELAERWLECYPRIPLLNAYGPTECSDDVSHHRIDRPLAAGTVHVPVGRSLPNLQLYVLDRWLRPLPVGPPGELFVGGRGVGRGYLGEPVKTALAFLPDPFAAGGGRLYRTGDLACWLSDGSVEFRGRVDHQLKVRGFRIEPGEIEAVLASHEALRTAVVIALGADGAVSQGVRLVGYVVPAGENAPSAAELREWLGERLPAYMVLGELVTIDELPLLPSGKVDRAALGRQALSASEGAARAGEPGAPRTPLEEVLASLWAEVLGRENVGLRDNFFDLGGHSLAAVRLVAKVSAALEVELALEELFDAPTVEALAASLEGKAGDGSAPPPIERVDRGFYPEGLPASFAQQRLWFIDQLEPESAAYNVPLGLRLSGQLEVPALARAFAEISRRHEVLRTVLRSEGGEPRQWIHAADALLLPVVELSHLAPPAREAELSRHTAREARCPFDLGRGPLARFTLLCLGELEHALLVTLHHAISDARSTAILVSELVELYRASIAGEEAHLPELPVQYADFAVWQRRMLSDEALQAKIAFWRERLAGAEPLLQLPADRARPATPSGRGGAQTVRLAEAVAARARAFGRRRGATLFMVLLSALDVLLARWSHRRDLSVGTPVTGRDRLELEPLIGFFVNTLVLRVDLSDDPAFSELLERVRKVALDAYAHRELPFEKLVEELRPERSLAHSPLFQVMLALDDAEREDPSVPGLSFRPQSTSVRTTKFDLGLLLRVHGDRLHGVWEYNRDLFDATTVERLSRAFGRLLDEILDHPESQTDLLTWLGPHERQQLLYEWNDTPSALALAPAVVSRLALQAADRPGAVAVVFGAHHLSYGELESRSNALARRLLARGVGLEDRVGLALRRSLDTAVALLAVLKTGAAFVPLDPSHPAERLTAVLEELCASVLVTEKAFAGRFEVMEAELFCLDEQPAGTIGEDRPPRVGKTCPESLAYVIYTSGSTGRPKGVMVEHRQLSHLLETVSRHFGSRADDRMLSLAPFSFDIFLFELLSPLWVGGTSVLVPIDPVPEPEDLLAALGSATAIHAVPALMGELLEALKARGQRRLAGPRSVYVGGERVGAELLAELRETFSSARIWELYGPTESTILSTSYRLPVGSGAARSLLGRPLAGVEVRVCDRRGLPVPIGVVGEIWLSGAGLARGYLGRGALTAAVWVPAEGGGRHYRTGDLGRHLASGELEFMGRIDHQVKVRGFRIELGEVEAALRARTGVREAVVVARDGGAGGPRLVAYVVPESPAEPSGRELRALLQGALPEYMMPSAFVCVDGLPLKATGKIDRAALARRALPASELVSEGSAVAPRTLTEELLCALWSEVLGLETVGAEEDFFELGGHSLLATRVISRIRETFQVELAVRTLFEAPTVAGLAAVIEAESCGASGAGLPPLERVDRDRDLPLSFAQQRLWFIDRLEPGRALYNMPSALRFERALDVSALAAALSEVVRRHEALRTRFPSADGEPVQRIVRPAAVPLPVTDLGGLPRRDRELEARRLMAAEAMRPFDLARGSLLRTGLLRLGNAEWVLWVTMHHIVSDGWSMEILSREVSTLYEAFAENRRAFLAELQIQYGDHAVWQRRWLSGEVLEAEVDYWRRQLAGAPPVLELPTDRPRPAVMRHRGSSRALRLAPELADSLRASSRERGVTLFMMLLAGFQALLSRWSGREDICVGTPIAGRNRLEIEGLIGFFVNTLVLRTRLEDDPDLVPLLGRVRDTMLEAHAHQDLPFEKLVEELQPERSLSHSPLFQVMLVFQNAATREAPVGYPAEAGDALGSAGAFSGFAKFELTLILAEAGGSLAGAWQYDRDLFDATTVARLGGQLETLLTAMTAHPGRRLSQLPLLQTAERHQMRVEWNDTARSGAPKERICERFETWASRTPDALAVVFRDRALSFGGLDARACRLARHLGGLGVGPGVRVGLCLERSLELVVAVLAVFKAGAAYVPLDPGYPEDRLAFMAADSELSVLVTRSGLSRHFVSPEVRIVELDTPDEEIEVCASANPLPSALFEDLAYVLYTSGSTGRPKGAMVSHVGLANLAEAQATLFGIDSASRILQFASLSFDASISEIAMAWWAGACLVEAPRDELLPGDPLASTLRRHAVTAVTLPPSALAVLSGDFPALEVLVVAGETCGEELARLWSAGRRFFNAYGPTETTVCATAGRFMGEGALGIGRPLAGLQIHVLGRRLEAVPMGARGELHVGGIGLARGYHSRPGLTAERFVPDPFGASAGARLYRTGDQARVRRDGALEFLGRFDHQVKVRGFRIELGEIEAALAGLETVREAVVVAAEGPSGDRRLVAWAVAEGPDTLAPAELRGALEAKLPAHMIPSFCGILEALPRLPNGKVDRGAVSRMAWPSSEPGSEPGSMPRTSVEEILCGILAEVLGRGTVGIDQDFFELGGHSLLATQVVSRVQRAFQIEMPVRALFEEPTVRGLALGVEAALREAEGMALPPIRRASRTRPLPLSFAQQRLWFLDQLEPGSSAYNVPVALRFSGELAVGALGSSFTELVRRHEVLRTSLPDSPTGPIQVIAAPGPVPMPLVDLERLEKPQGETELERWTRAEALRPFDLMRGPVLRIGLFRLGDREHVLQLVIHHVATDAWSSTLLVREVTALYAAFSRGRPSPLPDLLIQYADFSLWQRERLSGKSLAAMLSRWRKRLGGDPPVLELPTDRARRSGGTARRGAFLLRELPESSGPGLNRLNRARGTTPFMTLLAVFDVLLWRLTGVEDLVVGTAIAGRGHLDTEPLIGYFINMLPLRVSLDAHMRFTDLLSRVREAALGVFVHQDVPLEKLVEELMPARHRDGTPLFRVAFGFRNTPVEELEVSGLEIRPVGLPEEHIRFDLTVWVSERGGSLQADWRYDSELFDEATIDAWHGAFASLLSQVAETPETRLGQLQLPSREVRDGGGEGAWEEIQAERLTRLGRRRAGRSRGAVRQNLEMDS